ncbi:unnamed protein product [Bursaphelenchus xylophilus]|uniref:Dynein light intermediate chain n=1 Tax=Bursaphelenchus xylophilus TaxID=6326 RepID=A0A1I7RKV2_BURXY|nr:unnamed protein product [Bursaphelenchus xylophilus]CAG9083842.1 unnamed protein product [Bursaphelenchus xylophilus]
MVLREFPTLQKQLQQDEEKIWTKILEDVSSESSKVTQGGAIVMGEPLCGKSSLIARMVNSDRIPVPSVFEYNFLTVHANEDNRQTYQITSSTAPFGAHDSMNLPLWLCDGSEQSTPLFEFAFPKQLSKLVVVLCASASKPYNIIKSLMALYKIAEQRIEQHYSEDQIKDAKAAQVRYWQEYVEPAESMYIDNTEFRSEVLELEQGVLTDNCGATVIVVLTKTDETPITSAEDVGRLQFQLRRFCLRLGASLFYTSAKTDTNTALLRKYIAHRIYGVPFSKPAHIVDETSIFIPSGWDSMKKLDSEKEMLKNPDQEFESNAEELPLSGRDRFVECEDEQGFLQRLAKALAENPASPKREGNAPNALTNAPNQTGQSPLANFFGSLIKKDGAASPRSNSSAEATAHFQKLAATKKDGQE